MAVTAAFEDLVALRGLVCVGKNWVVAHGCQELVEVPEVVAMGLRKRLRGQEIHW